MGLVELGLREVVVLVAGTLRRAFRAHLQAGFCVPFAQTGRGTFSGSHTVHMSGAEAAPGAVKLPAWLRWT